MVASRLVFHQKQTWNAEVRRLFSTAGELYAGVGNRTPGAVRIFRLDHAGCRLWDDETPAWLPSPRTSDLAFAEFQGHTFVGTSTGEIRQLTPNTWPKPAPHKVVGSVTSMAVLDGHLYAAASSLHRTANGIAWSDLGTIRTVASNEAVDGAWTLEPFGGHLYAGVGFQAYDPTIPWKLTKFGIEIWRSSTGTNWKLFKRVEADLSKPGAAMGVPQHVHAMKAFGGHLYIGEYEGDSGVFRTDGTSSSWEWYPAMPSGSMLALEVHDGKLYAGLYSPVGGTASSVLLYSTADGKTWNAAAGSPKGPTACKGVTALASHGPNLYVGTDDSVNGGQIYEVGSDLPLCMVADIYRDRPLISVFDLMIRNLGDLKPIGGAAASAKHGIENRLDALADPCVHERLGGQAERLIAYLRPVAEELSEVDRLAAALETEDERARVEIAGEARRHAAYAYTVYRVYDEILAGLAPREGPTD